VSGVIRIAIVDDHPAVRLGLHSAIKSEPGLVPAGTAATAAELMPLLYSSRPDIVLLDFNLPDADGISLCHQIKTQALAPGVIIYSAFADASMTMPAVIAGADGILDKGLPARDLFEAIREVNSGGDALPPIARQHLELAAATVEQEDLPIFGMLLERTPHCDIADTLRIDQATLRRRIDLMLAAMVTSVGVAPARRRLVAG
jgi:DNA-binding NarL/FixJ family response regulator